MEVATYWSVSLEKGTGHAQSGLSPGSLQPLLYAKFSGAPGEACNFRVQFSSFQFSSGEPISRPIWQHLSAKPSKPAFISNKVDIFIIICLIPESDRVQNSGSEGGGKDC